MGSNNRMTNPRGTPHFTEEQKRTLKHFNDRSDYWNEIYQNDGSYTSYALRKQHHFVLDLIDRTADVKHILDVGCGTGVTAIELAKKGYEVSGIDIAPNMIQRAQAEALRQNVSCDFRTGVAEKLPYPDQSFDVLLALGLLGNILEDRPVLNEMARVLRSGGRLILTMPNLLALDLLVALPKSLPIMLGATRFRLPLRNISNAGRRLTGRPIKDALTLRFNQCVIPQRFVRHLQQNRFPDVNYYPLTFGPFKPLGLEIIGDRSSISISERIGSLARKTGRFRWFGSVIVYDGYRA